MVPAEFRAAYRLLKNSGYLPAELQLRKDIQEAEQLLLQTDLEQARACARLELLQLRLNMDLHRSSNLLFDEHYRQRLLARLEHD